LKEGDCNLTNLRASNSEVLVVVRTLLHMSPMI